MQAFKLQCNGRQVMVFWYPHLKANQLTVTAIDGKGELQLDGLWCRQVNSPNGGQVLELWLGDDDA
jgi:hypothetical protein